ncbi:hypothetical protein BU24DRAFT_416589 [Aaosphaeria arxii CBS 175.79]|uniref:DUF7708 domain-containing protein n=1 Tax=Aaosphaeria arxii CBS 175.79 TaxID=1450172 RepID=A0A6A5Y5Z7_9PLEO|nr:uncharacterized protein BU24DRAFT_416589 [Aaosphaeria arxii CBS 175.79]KAF2020928.1 hypothetical protein BU24DRAFT_416589 [Aaosphaeria arxii CBS 175.79]
MEDVFSFIEKTKRQYDSESQSRRGVFRWLGKFSARLMYYGQVLDVIAQHHPEYVALAWGAIKFIFMSILNHSQLLAEFTKALACIGDALRQTRLTAELYQTDAIKEAIAQLYAHIMLFFQKAMRWYNRSSVGRAVSAIFEPYELEYKDTVEQIKLCAETVEDIANAASRAETRDINITINLVLAEMRKREVKLALMQEEITKTRYAQCKMEEVVNSTLLVATTNKTITERIDGNIQDMTPRIRDIQFSQILQALDTQSSSRGALPLLQSITQRARASRTPHIDSTEILRSLQDWFSAPRSSFFVVRVGTRAESRARELAGDVITLLQSKDQPVIWRLSSMRGVTEEATGTVTSVIKELISEILRLDPSLINKHPDELNISQYLANHSETEWLNLLQRFLSRLGKCFIIIEAHDLFRINKANQDWMISFLMLFQQLLGHGACLKVLVLAYGTGDMASLKDNECMVKHLRPPTVIPASRKRAVVAAHKRSERGWRRMQPKI